MDTKELELKFHPIAKKFYKITIYGSIFAELVIFRLRYLEIEKVGMLKGIFILILASTVPITILIRSFIYLRPRIYSVYKIFDDHFTVEFKNKVKEYSYTEIKAIEFSKVSARFLGGFKIIFKSGQKIIVLSILENNHILLKKIGQNTEKLISKERIYQYEKTCELVKLSWNRIRKKLSSWPRVLYKYLGLSLTFSLIHFFIVNKERTLDDFLQIFAISEILILILSGLLNHTEERIINWYIVKNSSNGEFKQYPKFENTTSIIIEVVFYLICILGFYGITF